MLVIVLIICLCAKSEVLSLLCILVGLLSFLYKVVEENPHNDL